MEQEVVVEGVLAFALRLSRTLGLSPLHLDRNLPGQPHWLHRIHSLYGFIYIAALNITCIAVFIVDIQCNINSPHGMVFGNSNTEFLGWLVYMILAVLGVDIGLWTARDRLCRIYGHLKQMQQENFKVNMNRRGEKQWREKKRIMWLALMMLAQFLLLVVDYTSFFTNAMIVGKQIFIVYLYISFYMLTFTMTIFTLEVVGLVYAYHAAIETLNDELLQMLASSQTIRALSATEEENLRRIGNMYLSVGDDVTQFVNSDGSLILLMVVSYYIDFTVTATVTTEAFISIESEDRLSTKELINLAAWCLLKIIFMVIIVEPCHKFQKEVERMRVLAAKLMYRTQAAGEPSALTLQMFCKQLQLEGPSFTPLGVCTITRSLLTTAISAVAACLVFVVQYRTGNANEE